MKTVTALLLLAALAFGGSIYEADYSNDVDNQDRYTTSPDDSYYDYAATPDQYDDSDSELDSNYVPDYRYIIEPPEMY